MDWVENRLNHPLQSIAQDNTEFLNYLTNTQKKPRSDSFESEDNTMFARETAKDSEADHEMTSDQGTNIAEDQEDMSNIDQFIMKYSVEIQASTNIEYYVDEVISESKRGDHQPILNSYHLMTEE